MDTKTALLDCAENAARARGYDGFSFADLAAGVGIRKASVHHHFPTKADLALALIERYTDRLIQDLATETAKASNGADRIGAYINLNRAAIDGGKRLCLCIAFSGGADGISGPVLAKLDAWYLAATRWLGESFAIGKRDGSIANVDDPVSEGEACLAQTIGAQLIGRASGDVTRYDAAIASLASRLS